MIIYIVRKYANGIRQNTFLLFYLPLKNRQNIFYTTIEYLIIINCLLNRDKLYATAVDDRKDRNFSTAIQYNNNQNNI